MTDKEKLIISKVDDSELLEYIDNLKYPFIHKKNSYDYYNGKDYLYYSDKYNDYLLHQATRFSDIQDTVNVINLCDKLNMPITIKVSKGRAKYIIDFNSEEYVFDICNLEDIELFLQLLEYKYITTTQAYYISNSFIKTNCKIKKVKLALKANTYHNDTLYIYFTKKCIILKENNRTPKGINYLNTLLYNRGMPVIEL